MIQTDNFSKVEVHSQLELREWLELNHLISGSVWLVTFKINMPERYISTSEVLDELLCFGWIDGIRRKLDETRTMQLISPRKVEHWSKSYKDRVAKLIQEGKMQEAGLRTIELSKQNGLWDFMDDVDKLVIPKDLQNALHKYEGASIFFHSINDSSKRFVLRWLKLAKSNLTRAKRIEELVKLSAEGEKLNGS